MLVCFGKGRDIHIDPTLIESLEQVPHGCEALVGRKSYPTTDEQPSI